MVQHSKEWALSNYDFECYVDGCYKIDDVQQRNECLFVAFVAGRLGLRAGELLHMRSDWVDWRNRMIDIPAHEPCRKGDDGDICGYCAQHAEQKAEHSELSLQEARAEVLQQQLGNIPSIPGHLRQQLSMTHMVAINSDMATDAIDDQITAILESSSAVDDADEFRDALDRVAEEYRDDHQLGIDKARDQMWSGKTENAARSVPFDWSPRSELAIERLFAVHEEWPYSMSAIRRRVNKPLRLATGLNEDDCMPHGLRATAASHLAGRGISAAALMAMFGWAQISTAQAYIASSPDNTQSQLNRLA